MTSSRLNRWLDKKWAIAFSIYLLVLLSICIGAYLRVIPVQIAVMPAYDMLGHFILMGIASYLSYLALRRRMIWIWGQAVPVGPLMVSLVVLVDEMLQGFSPYRTVSLADVAAGLSGVVLFYRLARTQRLSVE